MRLNIEFVEGRNHAWLVAQDGAELFIQRPLEAVFVHNGALACKVPSHQMEEIRRDQCAVESLEDPSSVFLCVATPDDTKLYSVTEAVTYAGGDCLLFIKPLATIH